VFTLLSDREQTGLDSGSCAAHWFYRAAVELFGQGETLYSAWHVFLRPSYWRWKTTVKNALLPGTDVKPSGVSELTNRGKRIVEIEQWFGDRRSQLGTYISGSAERLSAAGEAFRCVAALRGAFATIGLEAQNAGTRVDADMRRAAAEVRRLLPSLDSALRSAGDLITSYWPNGFAGLSSIGGISLS